MRIGLLAQAVAFIPLGGLLIVLGARTSVIRCQRSTTVSCSIANFPLEFSAEAFEPQRVDVSYRRTVGKQNRVSEYGRLVLTDARGVRHTSIEADYADGVEHKRELERFLIGDTRQQLRLFVPGDIWMFGFGLLVLWMGVSSLRVSLHGCGRVHLELSPDRRTLHVRRTLLGIGLTTFDIDVSSASAVALEWGPIKHFWRSRHSQVEQGGRLHIQTARGPIALLPTFARGRHIHYDAAERVRALLGLPQLSAGAAAEYAPHHAPVSFSGIFAAVWTGACTGAVVGVGLGALGALTIGAHESSEPAGGPWYFGGLTLGVIAGIALAVLLERRTRYRG